MSSANFCRRNSRANPSADETIRSRKEGGPPSQLSIDPREGVAPPRPMQFQGGIGEEEVQFLEVLGQG